MRPFFASLLPLVLFSFCLTAQAEEKVTKTPPSKPNILFILVDDMGWSDTSVPFHFNEQGEAQFSANNKIFKTPGMERLASQGMRFTSAYAASVCSPSRTAILSGQNPSRTHITNWTSPDKPRDTSQRGIKEILPPPWNIEGLAQGQNTMASLFKKEGYKTLYVGKAHFGPTSIIAAQPPALGFDVNIGGSGAGQPGSYLGEDNYAEQPRRQNAQNTQKPLGPRDVPHLEAYHGSSTFLTEALTTELSKEIQKSRQENKPFFAYFGHYAVHGPLMEDPAFSALYPELKGAMKKYATLISGSDASILKLLELLEKEGIAENTLIIFASDNGGTAPKAQPCAPLRAKKGTPYEGGIRTPLILAWAKKDLNNPWQKKYPIPAGSINSHVVALQDLYKTLGTMLGSRHLPQNLDSLDFSGYLTAQGQSSRPETYFLNFPHQHEDAYYTLYREGDWKVIYHYKDQSWELYNLKKDIQEKQNLAQKEPEKLLALAKTLLKEHKRHKSQSPLDATTKQPLPILLPKNTL